MKEIILLTLPQKLRKFADRLLTLREKFSVSQTEMAKHFDVGLRMYQKYENGKAEPTGITYGKWIKRMDLLEKLETLPPLQIIDSPKSVAREKDNYRNSDIEELRSLLNKKDELIRVLELRLETAQLTINLLAEKAGVPLKKIAEQPT